MNPHCAAIFAIASAATSAHAQYAPMVTVTATLDWREVDAQGQSVPTPNGLLEPGESARIGVSLHITPNTRTTVTFPSGQEMLLLGLGSAQFDLFAPQGPAAAAGQWDLNNAIPPAWDLLGYWGVPQEFGSSVVHIGAAQFSFHILSSNSQNPIPNIWQGTWTPQDYTPREVAWELRPDSTFSPPPDGIFSVILYAPGIQTNYYRSSQEWQPLNIPIVPTPGAASLLIAAIAMAPRRRRN